MQLRVARLCLDCEELHVADACPVCASQRYAFLSAWLPSEERRRSRRRPRVESLPQHVGMRAVGATIAKWFGHEVAPPASATPLTRAIDHVAGMSFKEPPDERPRPQPTLEPDPVKRD
jgi:hypothetical protein